MLYTERIKALRSDHDLNQTQVAQAIHVAQTTYSDYEKGKSAYPGRVPHPAGEILRRRYELYHWCQRRPPALPQAAVSL